VTAADRHVRPSAVAGAFYPREPGALRAEVDGLLADARARGLELASVPRALVVPHAGYVYSGPVAASAYATVADAAAGIRRVVLLGPAHRVPLRGMAVPSVALLLTPLGAVEVADDARARLVMLGLAIVDDDAHALEHSFEVQLPFLQRVFPGVPVLPVAVGAAAASDVERAIDALWDDGTLVVVSTDLSHYDTYESARRHDAQTADAILRRDGDLLTGTDACGVHALRGLLRAALARDLAVRALDLRSSGDTAGPRDQVVGYGAFVIVESSSLDADDRQALLGCAIEPVGAVLRGEVPRLPELGLLPPRLRCPGAAFTTLEREGALLGCIGTLRAEEPLGQAVARHSLSAAFADPRLPPITVADFEAMSVKVSVLSPMVPVAAGSHAELAAALVPGVDGLLVEAPPGGATFLPSVWTSLPGPEDFLAALWRKAGWQVGHWPRGLRAHRYRAAEVHQSGPRSLGRGARSA